ncbi:MAG TPA: GntR family transcriptional regulator [Thermodesulfobacteriota bacterium]
MSKARGGAATAKSLAAGRNDTRGASSRGEIVYAALRAEIREGKLAPGDRLREAEIARRLHVSRTPVREALKRLQSDGLAAFSQPKGLTVAELSASQVADLYAMREVLAAAAARFAAEHASDLEIESLKHLAAQHGWVKTPEQASFNDRQIDRAIAEAAHNVYLLKALNVLQDAVSLLGRTTYAVPGRIKAGQAEIAAIVQAIADRDPDEAERAARRHIRAAGAVRMSMWLGKMSNESR